MTEVDGRTNPAPHPSARVVPLLPRIARGDAMAVRAFVSRYERLIWSLARRYTVDRAEAEDAVQDVFLSLWQNAERFDETRASEAVFVTVVTRRRLLDRVRGRKRRPVATGELEELNLASSDLHPERCAEAAQAVRALDTLRPDQRNVLVLATRDGLTQEEIAERLGLPLGTVKTHVRRALIAVRQILLGPETLPAEGP